MIELNYGPLNKSLFTQELELFIKCLIHRPEKISFPHTEGTLHANIGAIDIDVSALLKKSHFSHLTFNQWDSTQHQNHSHPYALYPQYYYSNLTQAETNAIQSYTGSYYQSINTLLYGKLNPYFYHDQQLKNLLIDTCFVGAGLNKIIPEHDLHQPSYRGEHATPIHEINERIQLINDGGGITHSKAFLSTSLDPATAKAFSYSGCEIHFDLPYGKKIADLSYFSSEQEYLLLPSHILWKSYEIIDNKVIFHAKVVEPLIEGKDDFTQEDLSTFQSLVTWAAKEGISTDFITPHLSSFLSDVPPKQEPVTSQAVCSDNSTISLLDCLGFEDNNALDFLLASIFNDLDFMLEDRSMLPVPIEQHAPVVIAMEHMPILLEVMA